MPLVLVLVVVAMALIGYGVLWVVYQTLRTMSEPNRLLLAVVAVGLIVVGFVVINRPELTAFTSSQESPKSGSNQPNPGVGISIPGAAPPAPIRQPARSVDPSYNLPTPAAPARPTAEPVNRTGKAPVYCLSEFGAFFFPIA